MNIVVVGGGIIGCTTAYYITRNPSFSPASCTVTVLEASALGVAQGASGKAGGLVAQWARPKPLVDVSFRQHVKLAEEHNGKDRWGWRFVGCGSWEGRGEIVSDESVSAVGQGAKRSLEKTLGLDRDGQAKRSLPDDLDWVAENLTDSYSTMASDGHTAQVHPFLFTKSMMDLAIEKGASLLLGKATAVNTSEGRVASVSFIRPGTQKPEQLAATHVIICAGAWSPKLVSHLPITPTRAHSVTVQAQVPIAPYVLFTEITLGKETVSPEIYARPDNEIYICGSGDDLALPETVDDVKVDLRECETILKQAKSISNEIRTATLDKQQACYLPLGGPIVGAADHIAKGLYIATGHTCWGICNAPGTALAISELVMHGKITCASLRSLEPSKFF
ncbi:FAD dependent oxidoreductase [Mycena floridula]|nr:FAD dependent oxidoreductase [Mycena floridula]